MLQDFRARFKQDLVKNFQRLTDNFSKNLVISDIEKEGIMYACSVCVEFKKNAGFLSVEIINDLSIQVGDVLISLFDEFNSSHIETLKASVNINMLLPNAQSMVDSYYNSY